MALKQALMSLLDAADHSGFGGLAVVEGLLVLGEAVAADMVFFPPAVSMTNRFPKKKIWPT
ncbi:MAG TPA: hypothetical protein ENN32_03555 [Chloroflexi bacterium]|nr:hypothetical protein [Chloroflexota bacterium]